MDDFTFQRELAELCTVEQDPRFPRMRVAKELNDFPPTSRVTAPTQEELLLQEITGESNNEFNSRIQKSVGYKESLDTVDLLTKAIDGGMLKGEMISSDVLKKSSPAPPIRTAPLTTQHTTERNRNGGNHWVAIAADRARARKEGRLAQWKKEYGIG
jgi:hypothetical protein